MSHFYQIWSTLEVLFTHNTAKFIFAIKSFQVNVPFLHPLKTLANQRIADVFMGY